jgi:tetratricopeptide (TPR) repeat protein
LALCQELGDRRNAAAMWSNRGESARLRGDCASAKDLYQKALGIAREIGHRESEIIYLSNLAGARLGLRQFEQAETDLREVIALAATPNRARFLKRTVSSARLAWPRANRGKPTPLPRKRSR